MPDFGDFEADDSFSLGDADPEAAARILLNLVRRYAPDTAPLDALHPWLRAAFIFAMADFLARLRREGAI